MKKKKKSQIFKGVKATFVNACLTKVDEQSVKMEGTPQDALDHEDEIKVISRKVVKEEAKGRGTPSKDNGEKD
mgnify:CR=1 FL=1